MKQSLLFILIFLLMSCKDSSSQNVPVYSDPSETEDLDYQPDITISEDDSIDLIFDDKTEKLTIQEAAEKASDEAEELIATDEEYNCNDSNNPKSHSFYRSMLEAFCQKHYNKNFSGRYYKVGSLKVDGSKQRDNTIDVWGTHTFQGHWKLATYEVRDFEAIIQQKGSDSYHIIFTKKTLYHIGGLVFYKANESIQGSIVYPSDK